MKPKEACLKQIRYWNTALLQAQKGIRRRNRLIQSLRKENEILSTANRQLMMEIAELALKDE